MIQFVVGAAPSPGFNRPEVTWNGTVIATVRRIAAAADAAWQRRGIGIMCADTFYNGIAHLVVISGVGVCAI